MEEVMDEQNEVRKEVGNEKQRGRESEHSG